MRIICLVYEGDDKEQARQAVSMMHRQIRAPEDVRSVVGDGQPIEVLLRHAFEAWRQLDERGQRDTAVLLQHDCELRKDAVDYLRKTYMPGRVVTYLQENPYLINGHHAMRLDPAGLVLLPPRFFRQVQGREDEVLDFVHSTPGSKELAFGYVVAKEGIQAGALGSMIPYCRPLHVVNMAEVETTGDFLTANANIAQ